MKDRFWITSLPKYAIISFVLLNMAAMFLYVGGNINNHEQIGYSFMRNFFSDLGRRHSYSGESNLMSCIFFNSSLSIVGLTFMILFYKIKNVFLNNKVLISLATIFGVFSGFSYIGVGFTPSDLYLDAHIFFAHWAFRALFAASILYSILILKTDGFEKRYAFGFIIFGIMVFSYVIYSEVVLDDPRINPDALVNHVVAQKMIAFWILFAVYIYSIGLGKYLYKKT